MHLRDFANHLSLHYGDVSKGKKAADDAIELVVARSSVRSGCLR